jgi:tetratricopeptide (TPR) repeat protein
MKLPFVIALFAGICSSFLMIGASGEVLLLKDGSKLEGTVTRTADGYEVKDTAGKVVHIDAGDVQSIQIGSSRAVGAVEIESRLVSLRHSVENLADLGIIIEDYRHFIDEYKDTPVAAEAQHDLAVWQQCRDEHLVKLGPRWVTQQERDQIRQQSAVQMTLARDLVNMAKPRDADALIQQVLVTDPGNPAASFLEGLLQFERQDMPSARKNFEAVLVTMNNHAATLNNLAIILWRQNQAIAAVNSYTQAMLAEPQSQTILDNVAEVLHLLPANLRQNPAAKRAAQIFAQQDAELQKQMVMLGLHRWGAVWVDAATFDQLQAVQKEVDDAVGKLSSQMDDLRQQISHLDTEIQQNQQEIYNIQRSSYTTDSKGHIIYFNTTGQTSAIQTSIDGLQRNKSDDQTKLASLQRDIEKEQSKIRTPKYTSIQKMIGIEQTPGLAPMKNPPAVPAPTAIPMPAGVATQPATPALPAGIKAGAQPAPTTR